MALVWLVECKICFLRFPLVPREPATGKSTDSLIRNTAVGRFECPHCHEFQDYSTDDFIPGEGRIMPSRETE
jgi:hypothetical protein